MATAVTATATNEPVHAAQRMSPCANIAGEYSKKNRNRASNTESPAILHGTAGGHASVLRPSRAVRRLVFHGRLCRMRTPSISRRAVIGLAGALLAPAWRTRAKAQ